GAETESRLGVGWIQHNRLPDGTRRRLEMPDVKEHDRAVVPCLGVSGLRGDCGTIRGKRLAVREFLRRLPQQLASGGQRFGRRGIQSQRLFDRGVSFLNPLWFIWAEVERLSAVNESQQSLGLREVG